MRLVSQGAVDLEAPVRLYVPELRLADEAAAAEVTVLNLLNHTAGLDWRVDVDSGEGDDALAREVAKLAESKLVGQPGARASYSTAGYDLAGRIIEKVTGLTYERAVSSLVLEPLGLSHSFFDRDDIMTRRFALGHNPAEDGGLSVARPWRHWRSDNPGGGLVSSVGDLVRWARFHLGDGDSQSGEQILPARLLHQMKEQTVDLRGTNVGDGIGICWFLRAIDGVRTVGHAGSANGQFAELLMVPERDFAVVALSNAFPNGTPFNRAVVTWTLEAYLGVVDKDPEPLPYDQTCAAEIVGEYGNDYMTLTIASDSSGLTLDVRIRPEIRARSTSEPPPDLDPAAIGLLPGGRDEYILTTGGLKGQRGFFTRDEHGTVIGVDLAGRLFDRVLVPAR
jgi:CubicO group peptidase (beta-lactamase class C family)